MRLDEIGTATHRGKVLAPVNRNLEGGVDHAEWPEQSLPQDIRELLSRDHLDQARGDVDAEAVMPARARLESEG